ncbi:MAG: low molecular weight phosphatase family protein [Elstera sp.]
MPPGLLDRPRLPSSILFMCTYNAVRSPMAMALLRQSHGRKVYVASAGVREGEADGFVTAVMGELGVDLRRHYPTLLEDLEDTNFDLIITLSPEAHHRALELTRTQSVDVEYWPTEDPSVAEGNREERLAAYRLVRDKLADRIADRFP